MAPTVCSEKKMRIEALKEVRRQSRGGVSQSSGNTTQHSRVLNLVRQQDRLLSIAIKTIKLVQRNKLLQKRLAQLQLETSAFIASVLDNPENRHLRDNLTAKKSLRH
ncbi:CG31324 [Drosophila busckii]|uniref:CG31324 n=1 Tax=Drosophila busckii TaxID=30019 RepID=A0A0M4EPF7_DROBS|nr:CG31324 [Drosophila busckii]